MRKTLLQLMLAVTAALPVMASAQTTDAPHQREGGRGQRRGNGGGGRPQQARQADDGQRGGQERGWQRLPAAQPAPAPAPAPTVQGQLGGRDGGQRFGGRDGGRPGGERFDGRGDRQFGGRPMGQSGRQYGNGQDGNRFGENRFNGAPERRIDGGDRRGYTPRGANGWAGSYADRRDDRRDQARFADRAGWNRGWRGNDRFDYGGYRSANRGAFHLPRYYAPRGWNYAYRRYSTGFRLSPLLFAESYWIDDPYDFRLPPAYEPYRWVRYYNDALLVDIDSGEVVDTVYDIFW